MREADYNPLDDPDCDEMGIRENNIDKWIEDYNAGK